MNILMLMAVTKPIICKVDQIQSILLHAHKSMGKGQDNKGNNKITELRTILQRESQNS
jgi:hypothetical protein